jgi:short-subunit dehydrogenase
MKDLRNMNVVITGAAGGFGKEYARQLLELGCNLILTDIDVDRLTAVTQKTLVQSQTCPGKIIGLIEADIAHPEGCRGLYKKSVELAGEVDILINNAGIMSYGDFHEVPQDKWEALMQVNLLAPMRLTFHFLPDMIRRGQGHLVFMSSVAGFVATSQGTPYSCSKFGLRGFGMGLSGELKDKGVDVTNIYPWWVKTDLLKSPGYGNAKIAHLPIPWLMLNKPDKVVSEIIKGIRKRKLHVYPGIYAKVVYSASRWTPIVSRQAH